MNTYNALRSIIELVHEMNNKMMKPCGIMMMHADVSATTQQTHPIPVTDSQPCWTPELRGGIPVNRDKKKPKSLSGARRLLLGRSKLFTCHTRSEFFRPAFERYILGAIFSPRTAVFPYPAWLVPKVDESRLSVFASRAKARVLHSFSSFFFCLLMKVWWV